MKLIDNFFKEYDFKNLNQQIIWNDTFPMYLHDFVSYEVSKDHRQEGSYHWFATHIMFHEDKPRSPLYPYVSGLLKSLLKWKTLLRLKINFYGHTDKIYEHSSHTDFTFKHKVALISLNTCNGFTRVGKKKIDSTANRALLFNGLTPHNSSTCTNSKGRWNMNVNYL